MKIQLGGPEVLKNLPVFEEAPLHESHHAPTHPVSTPVMIHRPSQRLIVENVIDQLAAPIWRMLGMYGR